MKNLGQNHYLLLGAWFVINLVQSLFTGLHSDESYYWMYSQHLDWGFFDHPPMIAFFIFLGSFFLPSEIGVRILVIILSTFTLALILNELNERKDFRFLTIFVLSFPLVHTHISGFLAIPDLPLLFFTLLFLVSYKKYLEKPGWPVAILIGIIIPAMIYSKYHAFLVIGFTLFSNLKLFKTKYFYGIIFISALLLLPHFFWQIENQFPTFRYHLIERASPFQIKNMVSYLFSILAVFIPLSAFIFNRKIRRIKIENLFQRALFFNIAGFFLLFLAMSIKNRIEIHWLSAIIPMLMMLVYPLFSGDEKLKKWFSLIALPVILLLFLFRFYLIADFIPNIGNLKSTFYKREKSALEIKKLANGELVGFFNNYAAVSNYIFYTGEKAVHLSTPGYRFCQYDLWDDENYGKGKSMFVVTPEIKDSANVIELVNGKKIATFRIPEFQSLKKLLLEYEEISIVKDSLKIKITLKNQFDHSIFFNHPSMPLIGYTQPKKNEISSMPIFQATGKESLAPGELASFGYNIPLKLIDTKLPLLIFTQTIDRNRGNIISFDFPDDL